MRDAGDDGLLTVWTHSLHRRGLEHLPLQHRHGGGAAWGQDGRRVASHVDEGPRPGTHMSGCRMREVARWRNVGATCADSKNTFYSRLVTFRFKTIQGLFKGFFFKQHFYGRATTFFFNVPNKK